MHFSVVIPLYNKQNSIAATLQSVLAQTYTNYEIIVVDDGSTDDSARIAEEYIREVKGAENSGAETTASCLSPLAFRLIRKPNGGVCSARNRGIQEARYDYVALLDGDDLWDEHYLEEQVKLIQDFPEAKMWGINFAEMSNGNLIRKLPTGLPDGYRGYVENYFQMPGRISDLYCSSSVVIQKEVFDKVGYFDERIKYAEDSDMWFRIIATYPVAFYDRYMAFYQYDAENRAMNRTRLLKYFLPYYVDKYQDFKHNAVFYRWINRWAANHIRLYYFGDITEQRTDAQVAAKKLDYYVIPNKYRFLYGMPYPIACVLNKLDKWYHR
jgi:glycosyltransferase involved in cell wall biosynthesis